MKRLFLVLVFLVFFLTLGPELFAAENATFTRAKRYAVYAALACFTAFYMFQIMVVSFKAIRTSKEIEGKEGTLFSHLFTLQGKEDGWYGFLVITLLFPFGLTVIPSLAAAAPIDPKAVMKLHVFVSEYAYRLVIGMLVVLITLEISYWYNMRKSGWKVLLISAFVLDFLVLLFLTLYVGTPGSWPDNLWGESWPARLFVAGVGILSFISSFLVLYFLRLDGGLGFDPLEHRDEEDRWP